MSVEILCVYDEGSQPATSLIGAKGTSLLVSKDGKKVLFNTGLRDRYLIHNMEFLEIGFDDIDAVVVSQSNPSDSGALNGLLSKREKPVDVYCPAGLYGDRGFLSRKVGLKEAVRGMAVFHDLGEWTEVFPGIHVSPFVYDADGYGETFMVVEEEYKVAILSGRCSCGPDKMVSMTSDRFGNKKIQAFIGPVFLEKKKKPVAAEYAEVLRPIPDLYLNHCTGVDGMTNLRVNLGLAGVTDFYVGHTYKLK